MTGQAAADTSHKKLCAWIGLSKFDEPAYCFGDLIDRQRARNVLSHGWDRVAIARWAFSHTPFSPVKLMGSTRCATAVIAGEIRPKNEHLICRRA